MEKCDRFVLYQECRQWKNVVNLFYTITTQTSITKEDEQEFKE